MLKPLRLRIDALQQQSVQRAIGGAFVAGFRHVMAVCAGLRC
jgi:hypothetical protein